MKDENSIQIKWHSNDMWFMVGDFHELNASIQLRWLCVVGALCGQFSLFLDGSNMK